MSTRSKFRFEDPNFVLSREKVVAFFVYCIFTAALAFSGIICLVFGPRDWETFGLDFSDILQEFVLAGAIVSLLRYGYLRGFVYAYKAVPTLLLLVLLGGEAWLIWLRTTLGQGSRRLTKLDVWLRPLAISSVAVVLAWVLSIMHKQPGSSADDYPPFS